MPYEKIVVGTDGSATARIAEGVALDLAEGNRGELVPVSAYRDDSGRSRADQAVAAAEAAAQARKVPCYPQVVDAQPAGAITQVADEFGADLIVVGDVGMDGPRRFRMSGIAEEVAHNMPCDVLIVRTRKAEAGGDAGVYSRVLIATDGSPTADRAVRTGAAFADALGAAVALVNVGDEAVGRIILRAAAEAIGKGDAEMHVLRGDPGERIAEVAGEKGYDLVVVGNKGMRGALRFLLGAVPNKVAHLSPCDVLIVNTADRSLEDLEPGEGALLQVEGKRVAAFRDEGGELVTLSPKCKHLGCTVGWNHEAKTWDCPCHGSRYDARGKVIRGPAQRDLDPAEV